HPSGGLAGFGRFAVLARRSTPSTFTKHSRICHGRSLWPSISGVCASTRLTRAASASFDDADAEYEMTGATINAMAIDSGQRWLFIRLLVCESGRAAHRRQRSAAAQY